MKRFAEQFNKKASGISLRASERRELRDRIVSYMEYHPLPAEMRQPTPAHAKDAQEFSYQSEPFTTISFDFGMIRNVVGLLAIILVVGVPTLAERSVPGDVLYPVKVQFNEEVRSTLAISAYAQVEWETERLERRLAEARLLASEGKLTEEVEAEVTQAIKTHSDSAKANIAKIRETDADEAAIAEIAFASALAVQSEVLEGQAAKEGEGADSVEGRSVAKLATVMAEESRVAEATQATSKPSYEKLLARVEMETTEAYELFASIEAVALAEEVTNIERRLNDIGRNVAEAINLHEQQIAAIALESDSENTTEANAETEVAETETVATTTDVDTDTTTTTDENIDVVNDTEPVAEVLIETPVSTEPVDPEQVITLLRDALTDTQKLISFMTNIDIRENVNIEELVPVSLTDDEKILLIKSTLEEVSAVEREIDKRAIPEVSAEKFAIGSERLASRIVAANEALVADELGTAQAHANEALLIATDLFAMTSATPQLEDTSEMDTEITEDERGTSTDTSAETDATSTTESTE